jgi:hypothetical protein
MRRIRFAVLAIASFVTVLIATLLSPGTWLNRALSAAICTIFSFNSTFCVANLARSSGQVMAANPPNQISTRPEFHQPDSKQPQTPATNPQAAPASTQTGVGQNQTSNQSRKCDTEGKIHAFYINGIRNSETVYDDDWSIISSVLRETSIKNIEEHKNTYNPDGIFLGLGDFAESSIQAIIGRPLTPSGRQVINHAVSEIKNIDKDFKDNAEQQAENDCECQPKKPKYIIIAHSQGNFFAKEIAEILKSSKSDIFQRLSILSIASFTNYEGVIGSLRGDGRFEYMLRSKDFPFRYRDINVPFLRDVSNPGPPNILDMDSQDGKLGKYQSPNQVLANSSIKDALLAHGLDAYLGDGSKKEYQQYTISVRESRKQGIEKIQQITTFDPGSYKPENKSKKCQNGRQSPQQQQTPQQPSITITITGPNVIEVNEKTTVEVKFVAPACRATSVTLWPPSLALPRIEKPIPAESACGGTVSFTVGSMGNHSYGCGEYKNVFNAVIAGTSPQLSAYSPPVTVKHKPGSQDYWSCYAWPLE